MLLSFGLKVNSVLSIFTENSLQEKCFLLNFTEIRITIRATKVKLAKKYIYGGNIV